MNGLTSLLNAIDALKPKNETQRGIISNVMNLLNLYKKIDTLLKELVKKREHLLLNILLDPPSLQKIISTYILPLLSKPRNNEVQDKSLIVLELEKND